MNWPHWLRGRDRKAMGTPPLGEQAPVQGAGLLGALSPAAAAGDSLPGGEGFLSLRKMQHDPQVKACLSTKKCAALSQGWSVRPASASGPDEAAAAFCRDALARMRGSVTDLLHDALDALALGVAILEINWAVRPDGRIGIDSVKAKDPALFQFETDEFLNVTGLLVLSGLGAADSLPPEKFVLYAHQPSYAGPAGTSDLRAAWQPWFLKQQLLRWWAKHLEKFGMPTVVGSYDASAGYTPAQQREFLQLLAAVHNESAMVYPKDMDVRLLESARAAQTGFAEAVAYCDRAIAKSILGQTLTSDSADRGGTYALGAVHLDVLRFYLQKLQRDLEETVMERQILRRLVDYNFGPETPCPAFCLGGLDDGRLAASAQLITGLVSGGIVAPGEPWVREYLGIPAAGEG